MPEHPAPAPAVYDTVELSRLVLGLAAAGGADSRALARDAGLPGWLLGLDQAMVASHHHVRLWELAEHALQDPCSGLTAVSRHRVGDLDLYDYLFSTAGTVREALEITGDFFRLISTNCQLRAGAPADGGITYTYRHALPGGRGEELWTQFSIAGFCARIQAVAGRPVIPAHIAFAQPPPRSYRAFTETLGTRQIDFRAPATTFTLLAGDLDHPLPGADPVLARILRRYAATLPQPEPASWHSHFRQVLAEAIGGRHAIPGRGRPPPRGQRPHAPAQAQRARHHLARRTRNRTPRPCPPSPPGQLAQHDPPGSPAGIRRPPLGPPRPAALGPVS